MPLRVSLCSESIHQADETCSGLTAESRHEASDLSGRYDLHESRSPYAEHPSSVSHVAAGTSRLPPEQGEVSSGANPVHRISGISTELHRHENLPAAWEGAGHPRSVSQNDRSTAHDGTSSGGVDRQISRSGESSCARTVALSTVANAENTRVASGKSQLRDSSASVSRVQRGIEVVEPGIGHLERSFLNQAMPRFDCGYNHRCVQEGMGGSMQRREDPGSLVPDGERTTHQCVGNESLLLCSESFPQGVPRDACASTHGQQNHGGQHKQNGDHPFSRPVTGSAGDVAVLPVTFDHAYCRVSAGVDESSSRPGVQTVLGPEQLAARSECVSPIEPTVGPSRYGPVRRQAELPTSEFCELEAGPGSEGPGCFHNELEDSERICFSPILLDQQVSGQDPGRWSRNSAHNTLVDDTALVCQAVADDSRSARIDSQQPLITDGSTGPEPPVVVDRIPAVGGLENIRHTWRAQGFSEEAVNILGESRRKGTKSAYECAWRKWTSWCSEQQVDPIQATLADVINFLSYIFHDGREYNTLNLYRSALSAYHPKIGSWKVGQHPQIIEFMRGVFNRRPPVPRYTDTWDVDQVLQYIKDMGGNRSLSDKSLTLKLTMLLGLTNVGRAQEIQSLNPLLMQDYGQRIVWPIAKLTKVKRPTKPSVSFELIQFDEDELLDVVQCLRVYLQRTHGWRITVSRQEQLLLAIVKPHHPVAVSTVSRWLKELMGLAGIDTERYKGHSVRSAATSKTMTQGLNIGQILERANWSKANTFYRFYYRNLPNEQESFQNRVLQSK